MPNRRDLFKVAALQAFAAGIAGAKIPNATMDKGQAKLTNEAFGDLRVYFDGPTDQLKAMTFGSLQLKPGMEPHPPHEHPEEEIMVITEGTGEMVVDGKATKVGPGSSMYCAGGKLHGIKNTGKTPLLFYYMKWKA
jgi:mannose-6-phosphate isomerase-like protein (cupin superfamily)